MAQSSDDVLSIADAATFSERSKPTIRRWIDKGKLIAVKAPAADHGGSPPWRIRRGDLVSCLVESGQTPKSWVGSELIKPSEGVSMSTPATVSQRVDQTELETLRNELQALRLEQSAQKLEVAKLEADGLRAELVRLEVTNTDLRSALADSRETIRAQRAELGALKSEAARGWLDRLLGRDGPARPLLTDEN